MPLRLLADIFDQTNEIAGVCVHLSGDGFRLALWQNSALLPPQIPYNPGKAYFGKMHT